MVDLALMMLKGRLKRPVLTAQQKKYACQYSSGRFFLFLCAKSE
jgi:hypothetical protein